MLSTARFFSRPDLPGGPNCPIHQTNQTAPTWQTNSTRPLTKSARDPQAPERAVRCWER